MGALALLVASLLALALQAVASAGPSLAAPGAQPRVSVLAIGDSVMLGAEHCITTRGYVVDAAGSRRVRAVAEILRDKGAALPGQVVVHTGTNGGATLTDLRAVMDVIGPEREVIWVTVQLPDGIGRYTFEETTNHFIRSLPSLYPNASVADWNALSDAHPEWTGGDGIHLTARGCRGFAQMLTAAVRQLVQRTQHYVPM